MKQEIKAYNNVLELIGNTPLVISRNLIQNPNVQLLLKLEAEISLLLA